MLRKQCVSQSNTAFLRRCAKGRAKTDHQWSVIEDLWSVWGMRLHHPFSDGAWVRNHSLKNGSAVGSAAVQSSAQMCPPIHSPIRSICWPSPHQMKILRRVVIGSAVVAASITPAMALDIYQQNRMRQMEQDRYFQQLKTRQRLHRQEQQLRDSERRQSQERWR